MDSIGIEIDSEKYTVYGTSKAKRLRAFWKLESDQYVGRLIGDLVDCVAASSKSSDLDRTDLIENCRQIALRLLSSSQNLEPLRQHADVLDASYLKKQIRRIESSIDDDPELAIGTAKELVESCCKTILAERGKPISGRPDIPELTKATLKELKLVPEGIDDAARGVDVIRRLLRNLGTIGSGLAELRGLYGTGHGKHGKTKGLGSRHAKLAVGAATTLVVFLIETHIETRN